MTASPPIHVGLFGSSGRMGQTMISALALHPRLELAYALSRVHMAQPRQCISQLDQCDLIIDFTTVDAQAQVFEILSELQSPPPLITGVTGLKQNDQQRLDTYAQRAPVFWASNFSLGIALLKKLSALTAVQLGSDFDIEIFELHHRDKQDAPSGTALTLAQAMQQSMRGAGRDKTTICEQLTSPRDPDEIHVSVGRGGGVFGEHRVMFLGGSERLEIKHSALNRMVFAEGALRAAEWCLDRSAGRYTMDHLIG